MNRFQIGLATAMFSASAFAGAGNSPETAGAPSLTNAEAVTCEKVRETGSQRVRRECLTATQREARRLEAQSKLQNAGRCAGNEGSCVVKTW